MTSITLASVACALCNSETAEPAAFGFDREHDLDGEFRVVRCTTCDHNYLSPRPLSSEIGQLYPTDYAPFGDSSDPEQARRELRGGLISKLSNYRNFGRTGQPQRIDVVEIGCGSGNNLQRLVAAGCNVIGIEPSEQAAKTAGRFAEVLHGDDSALDELNDNSFDLAQGLMVLEHVPHPISTLESLRRVCRDGGRLEIMVPNFAAPGRARFGPDWFPLQLPRHFHHFTPASVKDALSKAGWSQIRVWHQPTLVDYWKSLNLKCDESSVIGRVSRTLERHGAIVDLILMPVIFPWVNVCGSSRLTVSAIA